MAALPFAKFPTHMLTMKGRATRERLASFLAIKSIAEVLFVCALAVGFYLTAFAPIFRGTLDSADASHVVGWVVNKTEPQARVEVQLYIDGRFSGNLLADSARPDVLAAGFARDDRHGFVFDTPQLTAGEHEARVYAVHASGGELRRTLQLIGQPLRFSVAAGNPNSSGGVTAQP